MTAPTKRKRPRDWVRILLSDLVALCNAIEDHNLEAHPGIDIEYKCARRTIAKMRKQRATEPT